MSILMVDLTTHVEIREDKVVQLNDACKMAERDSQVLNHPLPACKIAEAAQPTESPCGLIF